MIFFHEAEDFFTLASHILSGLCLFLPCILRGSHYFRDGEFLKLSGKSGSDRLQIAEGHKRIAEDDLSTTDLFHVIFNVFRVGSDDRAVIVVIRVVELVPFIKSEWLADVKVVIAGYESITKLSEKEKGAIPCVMECIEILFVAYFLGVEDMKHANDAYYVFRFIQNCEKELKQQ